MSKNILAIDVGGTKTRFALCRKNKSIKFFLLKTYDSKKIKNFRNIMREFLEETKRKYKIKIDEASIAVAGPVSGNKAKLTNLKIMIDAKELIKNTGLKKINLINDFAAICRSISFLKRKHLLVLKRGRGKRKVRVVIGAGTGLGMAAIINGKIVASEGGHVDVAAENDFEWALLNYLRRNACRGKWPDYESVVSGPGIINIYRFLRKIRYAKQAPRIKKELEMARDKAAAISEFAIKNKDKCCKAALDIFVRFYARFARFAALTFLANEVYIAGGIAPKIIKKLKDGDFVKEFKKSYKMEKILKEANIFVIMNENAGLIGAAFF